MVNVATLKQNERVRVMLDKIIGGMRQRDKVLLKGVGHRSVRFFDCYLHRFVLAAILKIV